MEEAGGELWITQSQGEGRALASKAAEKGFERIGAAGGDGTLAEVLSGVLETGGHLGLVPLGTGNDFARTLGVFGDPMQAVQTLLQGSPQPVDVGWANGSPFVNLVACGFDAVVGERINQGFGWIRGTGAYVLAVLQSLVTYRASSICLTVDGERIEKKAMLCAVANAASYGGGMKIAPMASISDGLLDVVMLEEVPKLEFLQQFPKVFRGEHLSHPKVHTWRGRVIEIEADPALPVLCEGDLIGSTPLKIHLDPGRVSVIHPPAAP